MLEEEKNRRSASLIPEWIWKIVLALGGALTIATIYFLGYTYHSGWLGFFHLDISAYPLAHEEYLIYGALAFFQTGTTLSEWSGQHKGLIAGTYLYFLFWIALWSVAEYFNSRRQKPKESGGRAIRHPHIDKFLLRAVVVAGCMMLFLIGIPLAGAILALPGGVGQSMGVRIAQKDAEAFGKSCAKAPYPCISLKKDGKEIAKGFRIAQSKERVALFANGVTSEYLLDGSTWSTVDHLQ